MWYLTIKTNQLSTFLNTFVIQTIKNFSIELFFLGLSFELLIFHVWQERTKIHRISQKCIRAIELSIWNDVNYTAATVKKWILKALRADKVLTKIQMENN